MFMDHLVLMTVEEKKHLALCRKIALSKINNQKEIEVWVIIKQEVLCIFLIVDGTQKIFNSELSEPLMLEAMNRFL